MELDEQNAENHIEMKKIISEIQQFKNDTQDYRKSKVEVHKTLRMSTDKNSVKREILCL